MKGHFLTPTQCALLLAAFASSHAMQAQELVPDTIAPQQKELNQAQVTAQRKPVSKLTGPENGFVLSRTELFKAACCNLGESFTTNPSVDVSYSDAATGAKQIKLLGLAGSYVQMLTENVPDFRGAASPYSLGYVPGPWMQSIQVSKGSASVKNGYESITGQINVEYKKPQTDPSLEVNLYGDTKSRLEANFDGNVHFKQPKLSTALLAHYEDNFGHHDENNDGFLDKPNVRQVNLMNRWAWMGDNYIFQAAVSGLSEKRTGGQTHHTVKHVEQELYTIGNETTRFTAFAKNAFIFDKERGTNLALILSGNYHDADANYGHRLYNVTQRTGYASLIFETNFSELHNLSAGASLNHDDYDQRYRLTHNTDETPTTLTERETIPGVYAQYTFNLHDKWVLMGGLRYDHSSVYGSFLTPRFHVKYAPNHVFNLRLSAGKGYRTVHALGEFNYLLASNRQLTIADHLKQEAAWNYGASANVKLPVGGHILDLSAEYYYTHFNEQVVADYDTDAQHIYLTNLNGHRSYSHTMQLEASYTPVRGLSLTAAYRYNIVRQFTGGRVQEKPFTYRFKGLLTLSYKTPLELWQFDLTAQLNGGGRLLANGDDAAATSFPAYGQLNAQITRWFRHCSVYVGGENLTNYKQRNPILHAAHPWSEQFDATQVWGPVHGAMAYAGIRINY